MALLSVKREVGEFKRRYKWMALFVVTFFAVLFAREFQLQVISYAQYAAIARENITKTIHLPATRGVIRDTKGHIIATNRPSFDVLITPSQIVPERDIPRIAELMNLDAAARDALAAKLQNVPKRRWTHQIEMFTDISRDQMAALEMHASELAGVDVISRPIRTYPYGTLGSHAIGFLNEVNADDLKKLTGQQYRAGDVIGRSGIEGAWESYLRGRAGFRRVLVDVRGQLAGDPSHAAAQNVHDLGHKDPVPGRDFTLTVDMDLMRTIDHAFRGHPSGAAVVVDVHTGQVRALYSKPSYDLNEMTAGMKSGRMQELTSDPFRPLIDKTVYETYFPGSTFKPVTALAALGEHIVDRNTRVHCTGSYQLGNRSFRCSQPHGDVDLRMAITRSCNVFFYDLATRLNLDDLARYAHQFGFGERTGFGINSEAKGFIPDRAWYDAHYNNRFQVGFTLNESIGQGNTRVTALQLAMAYVALANGGTLYEPVFVERVANPDGTSIQTFTAQHRSVNIPASDIAYVNEGLLGVVNDQAGTAYEARIDGGVLVAGKTGTAQVQRRLTPEEQADPKRNWFLSRDHAWFAGFAPANNPQVVCVVIVEHGGGGARNAAPIALEILQNYVGGGPPPPKEPPDGASAHGSRRTRARRGHR